MAADGQADFEIVDVKGLGGDQMALVAMAGELDALNAPAGSSRQGEAAIAAELTRTLAVTAGRDKGARNDDVAIEVMVDELGRFPLDCVWRALGAWRRNERWRPTLADLLRDVEWRARPRRVALEAVRKALAGRSP